MAGPSQGAGAAPALLHEAASAAAGPSTAYDGAFQPLLRMSAAQRSSWLQAAAAAQLANAAAAREEELSDAASLPEHATAQLNAEAAAEMWSSSSESSGAPVRRGMRRAKHELRHGIIGHAIDDREYNIDGINGRGPSPSGKMGAAISLWKKPGMQELTSKLKAHSLSPPQCNSPNSISNSHRYKSM